MCKIDAAADEVPAEIGLRSTKVPIEISSGVDEENSMAWVTDVWCIACIKKLFLCSLTVMQVCEVCTLTYWATAVESAYPDPEEEVNTEKGTG